MHHSNDSLRYFIVQREVQLLPRDVHPSFKGVNLIQVLAADCEGGVEDKGLVTRLIPYF